MIDPLMVAAKVTILLLVVLIGRALLARASAAAGNLVLTAGLAAVLALPLAAWVVPAWNLELPIASAVSVSSATPTVPFRAATVPDTSSSYRSSPSESASPLRVGSMGGPLIGTVGRSGGSPRGRSVVSRPGSLPWVGILWTLGAVAVCGRSVAGWFRMSGLARNAAGLDRTRVAEIAEESRTRLGLRRKPRILVSSEVRVPMMWGFLRPVLLLPVEALDWPAERMRVVMLHELAHVRRGDMAGLLLGRLATAAYWFHPLVWWVDRSARSDAERACDDAVLTSGERASDYAGHLVAIAHRLTTSQVAGTAALALLGRNQLEERVRSILHPRLKRGMSGRVVAVVCAATVVAFFAVSAATPVAQPPRAPAPPSAEAAHKLSLELVEPAAPVAPVEPVEPVEPQSSAPPEPAAAPFLVAQSVEKARKQKREKQLAKEHKDRIEAGIHASEECEKDHEHCDRAHEVHDHVHKALQKAFRFGFGSDDDGPGAEAFERAYAAHMEERFQEAIEGFEVAYEADFNRQTTAYNAACGHARLGQTAEAVRWAERALEAGFDSPNMFWEDSDFDLIRNEAAFREMLEHIDRHMQKSDRYAETIDRYRALVESDSADGDAWYEVGSGLLGMRAFEQAIDALEHAERLSGDDSQNALYNLACAYALRGQDRRALEMLERAVHAGFDSEERFRNDSDLSSIRGTARFEEIAALREFLSLERFQRGSRNGGHHYSKTRWAPAIEEYRDFVRREPQVGRAWFNLGWALHFSGRHDEAVEAFRQSADRGHRESTSLYNVACARSMQGDVDGALQALEQAMDAGFISPSQMSRDDDLDNLHNDPRFELLLERAKDEERAHHEGKSWWKRTIGYLHGS